MKDYRKIIAASLLIFSVFSCATGESRAEAGRRADLIITYSTKTLSDVDAKDADAAMKIYAEELARQIGYTAESHTCDSIETILTDLQNGRVDLVSLTSVDYLRFKNKMDVELAAAHVRGGKNGVKYLLIANQARGYTKLGDLKGTRVAVLKGDDIAPLFLNTILLKEKQGDVKTFFSSVENKSKASQTVLSVFFGQAEACITTELAFKTMAEMNPQLGRDLTIVASSKELATIVSLFRRALSDNIKQKTMDVARTLENNPRGRQVLLLFKIEALRPLRETDLVGIKDLVSEHDRLMAGRR
jgi:ABC-type phosphate/phosphonate transport system substrate-binding protein